jgi:hypothetical protein
VATNGAVAWVLKATSVEEPAIVAVVVRVRVELMKLIEREIEVLSTDEVGEGVAVRVVVQ